MASMDFAGPFGPHSNKINNYALVFVDNFSRYTFMISCNTNSAATALRVLNEKIFPITGHPETLIIDGAGAFVNKKFEDEMRTMNIHLDMVAPDNHRANGLAERQVRVLNDTMRQLKVTDKARWPSLLREIQLAIASTPSADTGVSPYEMWTGYPVRRSDLSDPSLPAHDCSLDPVANRRMTTLQRALARAHENAANQSPKRPYNLRPNRFRINDSVRVKLPEHRRAPADPETRQPTYKKWVGAWESRLRVTEDLGRNQFRLFNPRTRRSIKRSARQMAPEAH